MPVCEQHAPREIRADGVRALVSPVGADLLALAHDGADYVEPDPPARDGGIRIRWLAEDDASCGDAELGPGAVWDVVAHDDATVTLSVALAGGALSATTAFTVGDYGLATIQGLTNHTPRPVAVGLTVGVHPRAGATPAYGSRLGVSTDHLVGPDGARADLPQGLLDLASGRPVDELDLDDLFGGGTPPPEKTHVTHTLTGADGDGVAVWGDPPFSFAHVRTRRDPTGLRVALTTCVPGRPGTGRVVDPHDTWVFAWGVQPFACAPTTTS